MLESRGRMVDKLHCDDTKGVLTLYKYIYTHCVTARDLHSVIGKGGVNFGV